MKKSRLLIPVLFLMLMSLVPIPRVHAGSPVTVVTDQSLNYHNGDAPDPSAYIQDKFGKVALVSELPGTCCALGVTYSNDNGATWTTDSTIKSTSPKSDFGPGAIFSSDGTHLLTIWADFSGATEDLKVSRFSVTRDALNNIQGFVFISSTTIVSNYGTSAGHFTATTSPDSSDTAIIVYVQSSASTFPCLFQTSFTLNSFKDLAGTASATSCDATIKFGSPPSIIAYPSNNALMVTSMDTAITNRPNVILLIPHSSSGVWNFAGRSYISDACANALGCMGPNNWNNPSMVISGSTVWMSYFIWDGTHSCDGSAANCIGTIHLGTVASSGTVTDVSTLSCNVNCGNSGGVQGGMTLLPLTAGQTGSFAFSNWQPNAAPFPVDSDTVTFASGPSRVYVFFSTLWTGQANPQISSYYWDGTANSALVQMESISNQWIPVWAQPIVPPVVPPVKQTLCSQGFAGTIQGASLLGVIMLLLIATYLLAGKKIRKKVGEKVSQPFDFYSHGKKVDDNFMKIIIVVSVAIFVAYILVAVVPAGIGSGC